MSNFMVPSREDTLRIQQFIAQKVQQFHCFAKETVASSTGNEETIIPDPIPNFDHISKNGTQKLNVKTEQEKDVEARAKIIRECNAKKMVLLQNSTEKPVINSAKNSPSTTLTSPTRGKFGWETIEAVYVPYFLVDDEKYVSKRIIFDKIFKNIERFFNEKVFSCIRWHYSCLTLYEADILNDINCNHSDSSFGPDKFNTKDLKTTHDNFMGAYNFLQFCYATLVLKDPTKFPAKCGFVKINQENVVPYIVRDNNKYVPMFYFETNSSSMLDSVSVELTNTEMFYLRFCCKVQEIKKQFYEVKSCRALEIKQVCNLLPPNSTITDHWPTIDATAFLKPEIVAKQPVNNVPSVVSSTTVPSTIPTHSSITNKQVKPRINAPALVSTTTAQSTVAAHSSTPNKQAKPVQNYTSFKNGPYKPALAPYTVVVNGNTNATKHPLKPIVPASAPFCIRNKAVSKAAENNCYQSPILFVGKPPNKTSSTQSSTVTNAKNVVTSAGNTARTSVVNSRLNNMSSQQLIALKGVSSVIYVNKLPPLLLGATPYRVISKMVISKAITCINLNANDFTHFWLAAVDDIVFKLFSNRPIVIVEAALKYMGIDFYKLNEDQIKVVKKSHHPYRENEYFVLYDSFVEFLPQIKYMVENKK